MATQKNAARVAVQAELCPNAAGTMRNSETVPWSPEKLRKIGHSKPIRLLELGEGQHGKYALCEFPGGWGRKVGLRARVDAWHSWFWELPSKDRQRIQEHVGFVIRKSPKGVRKQSMGLSFATRPITRRGFAEKIDFFDVPEEVRSAGIATGYRAAAELFHDLRLGGESDWMLRGILRDVVMSEATAEGSPSKEGAASAFMEVVEKALVFMARHTRDDEWLKRRIDEAENTHQESMEQEGQSKAAFVERMRQAREAKRSVKRPEVHGPLDYFDTRLASAQEAAENSAQECLHAMGCGVKRSGVSVLGGDDVLKTEEVQTLSEGF